MDDTNPQCRFKDSVEFYTFAEFIVKYVLTYITAINNNKNITI